MAVNTDGAATIAVPREQLEAIVSALRTVRARDYGACYCSSSSLNSLIGWAHEPGCLYLKSQRDTEVAHALADTLAAALTAPAEGPAPSRGTVTAQRVPPEELAAFKRRNRFTPKEWREAADFLYRELSTQVEANARLAALVQEWQAAMTEMQTKPLESSERSREAAEALFAWRPPSGSTEEEP